MLINTEKIQNFTLTKKLDEIYLNQTKEKLIEFLGNPIDSSPQHKNTKEIFSYGVIQVYLFNNFVKGFTLDYQRKDHSGNPFTLEEIHQENILNFMCENQISYVEDTRLSFQEGKVFIVSNNLYLGFNNNLLNVLGLYDDTNTP